jgi:hypothetical protein
LRGATGVFGEDGVGVRVIGGHHAGAKGLVEDFEHVSVVSLDWF